MKRQVCLPPTGMQDWKIYEEQEAMESFAFPNEIKMTELNIFLRFEKSNLPWNVFSKYAKITRKRSKRSTSVN